MPGGDADLATLYSTQDYLDVNVADDTRVPLDGSSGYLIHQFKDYVGGNASCQLNWEGQVTIAPTAATVNLQIYNRNTAAWETVASNNTAAANTDFQFVVGIPSLTDYKDASSVISCRVYQLIP